MKIFKQQEEINKEEINKIEEAPLEAKDTQLKDETPKKKSFFDKIKLMFFIWNIFSIAVYTAYTLYNAYQNTKSPVYSKIILALLIAYAIAFVFLLIFGYKNKIQLKANMKNYKSATNILKHLVKILNLSLSITTALSVFASGGRLNIFTILFGVLAITITATSIFFEIIKMFIRKKLANRKERKLAQKENQQ